MYYIIYIHISFPLHFLFLPEREEYLHLERGKERKKERKKEGGQSPKDGRNQFKTEVIIIFKRKKEFARLFTVYGTILSSSHLLLLRARNKPRLSPQTGSFQEENQDNRVIVVAAGAGTSHLRRRLRDSRALKNTQMKEYLAHTVPGCCSVQSSARSRSRFNRPRK